MKFMTSILIGFVILITTCSSIASDTPRGKFIQPDNLFPKVKVTTTLGDIVLELDRSKAPLTVDNFLSYVDSGRYDNTIFHRLEPDFVLQGGGYKPDMATIAEYPPVFNESGNGLKNERLTIAMARQSDPHSATSQFFVNLSDNNSLDPGRRWGYTVFGEVIEGEETISKLVAVGSDYSKEIGWPNFPLKEIKIISAEILAN